jgi:hypothetical protein
LKLLDQHFIFRATFPFLRENIINIVDRYPPPGRDLKLTPGGKKVAERSQKSPIEDQAKDTPRLYAGIFGCHRAKAAPVGSTSMLKLPMPGISVTSASTLAPRDLAFPVEAATSSTRTYGTH